MLVALSITLIIQAAPVPADTIRVDHEEALLEPLNEEAVAADPSDLLELLEGLAADPLDVNAARAEELAAIPDLTPRLAATVVAHRERVGPFTAIEELTTVEGLTEAILRAIRPYITLRTPDEAVARRFGPVPALDELLRGARIELQQRVQRRLDLPRGYEPIPDSLLGTADEPTRYLGSPERLYTRIRATHGRRVSLNLTLEKDPGEPFTWDPGSGFYGYDFVSLHAAAMQMGRIEALVLGDFVAEFGQGLTLWRAAGFGKGSATVRPLVRRGRGIRPYGSTDENRFFRGAAATLSVTEWLSASAFASRRHYDARFAEVDTTGTGLGEGAPGVAGMPLTGLHRTRAEIERKNALGQTLAGGAVEVRLQGITLGAVGYAARFDAPLLAGDRPYQRFNLEGDRVAAASVFGHASLGPYHFFGEVGTSQGEAIGAVGGVEAAFGPLSALLLARHYPRDLASLHGYGFGERNGITQNETGVYLGIDLVPARGWTVRGYVDQFRFPWVRFNVPRPSSGVDMLLYVAHQPRQWLSVYAQARSKTREVGERITTDTGAELETLTSETRRSVRLQGEFWANRDLRLRGRVEMAHYQRAELLPETGVTVFHDVRWAAAPWITIDTRLSYFDTDGFNARLYQFENDLLGVMTNTLLHGRGVRQYVLLTFRPGGHLDGLDARIKLAATAYRDRHTVGSGLDQIDGNVVRDVGLQVRYRFGG